MEMNGCKIVTTNCSVVDFEDDLHTLIHCLQTLTLFAGGCAKLVLDSALWG